MKICPKCNKELKDTAKFCGGCGYKFPVDANPPSDIKGTGNTCPNCGNQDKDKMNVARRTCGYLVTNFWNKVSTQEIRDRVIHLDNKDDEE